MTVTINIPDTVENRLQQEAARTGTPIPALIESVVEERFGDSNTEFGGKTLGEVYGHLFRAVEFEPTNVSERDEEYLSASGFGQTVSQRDIAE